MDILEQLYLRVVNWEVNKDYHLAKLTSLLSLYKHMMEELKV